MSPNLENHSCAGDNCYCIGGDENHDLQDIPDCDYEPPCPHDLSDDAEALASAGWGTDEDYGCYSDGDFEPW